MRPDLHVRREVKKQKKQNKLGYGSTQGCAGLAPCYCIIKPFGASAAVTTDTGCLQMLLQDMGRRPCGKKWERFTDVSCISVTSQREVGRASIAGEMMNVLKEMKEKCCNEGNTLRFRFRVWIVAEPS